MPHGASTTRPQLELDHLVVAARTLDEGAAWCEATLGVMPEAGGRHAWMGTHNRLLSLSSACLPKCYLEIVAIDPQAPAPWRKRWFDLDTPEVREAIATSPRLVHWVARTHAIDADAKAFRDAGYDVGQPIVAERATPRGMLRWRITVRDDGGRPAGGAVPLLIEWGDEHPCDALPASGVELEQVEVDGVPAAFASRIGIATATDASAAVFAIAGPTLPRVDSPALAATFSSRLGRVKLATL